MSKMTETIKLTGEIVAKTKDALLWKTPAGRKVWVPLSTIVKETRSFLGKDEIVVSVWIAKKLGLTW